jgi:hypothetical protein
MPAAFGSRRSVVFNEIVQIIPSFAATSKKNRGALNVLKKFVFGDLRLAKRKISLSNSTQPSTGNGARNELMDYNQLGDTLSPKYLAKPSPPLIQRYPNGALVRTSRIGLSRESSQLSKRIQLAECNMEANQRIFVEVLQVENKVEMEGLDDCMLFEDGLQPENFENEPHPECLTPIFEDHCVDGRSLSSRDTSCEESVSFASTLDSPHKPTFIPIALAAAAAAGTTSEDDDDVELWPLVEVADTSHLHKRAASCLLAARKDAIMYFASNAASEEQAHSTACASKFLATCAGPAVAAMHRALMKVSVCRLVSAIDPNARVANPRDAETILKAFVGTFASTSIPSTKGAPCNMGLASRLIPSGDFKSICNRFNPPHPVVSRVLDRLAAILALARLCGLGLLYPAPGARYTSKYMEPCSFSEIDGSAPSGDSVVEATSTHVLPEGLNNEPHLHPPRLVKDLVFPGLIDAQGNVLVCSQVLL